MYGKQEQVMMWIDENSQNSENPAWKDLENVCKKWAVMSQHEKDEKFYEKLREISLKTRPGWQD